MGREGPETDAVRGGPPRLTFACELDAARLTELLADGCVVEDLVALRARVALMVSDLSPERAAVVRRLNDARVPVTGIPLFPVEEGYYFTVENASRAEARYEAFTAWSAEHALVWDAIGLDIEPDARIFQQIAADPRGLLPLLAPRLRDHERLASARAAYAALVARIHADGWSVENYQFPVIADERRVGATLLQRLLGLVDVATDREVWMLYTSFARSVGPGILWSYGPEAAAIAVGTTGGGPAIPDPPEMPTLTWEEFARDLRLARHWSDEIHVHSLEGCVWQGHLGRLRSFDWSGAAPPRTAAVAGVLRRLLRAMLWASVRPRRVALAAAAAAVLLGRLARAAR